MRIPATPKAQHLSSSSYPSFAAPLKPRAQYTRMSAAATAVAEPTATKAKLKIADVDVSGKRVFMRVDFNVPQDKKDPTIITNTQRIDGAIPTIKAVLDKGAKSVVLASHLGRPDGQVVDKFSLAPVAKIVSEKLGRPVVFLKDIDSAETAAATADPEDG